VRGGVADAPTWIVACCSGQSAAPPGPGEPNEFKVLGCQGIVIAR